MEQRRTYSRYTRTMQAMPVQRSSQQIIEEVPAYSLAMVVAPRQSFVNLYDESDALKFGTMFRELNKPFAPFGRKQNG